MDLSKYSKPIHITCPKCHYDLEFNGGKYVSEKNELADDIRTLKARMQTYRNEYGKDGYYYRLVKQLKDKEVQYSRAKHMVQLLSEQSEINLFCLFKKVCMKEFGEEKITKMLQECEDELVYRNSEIRKQNHTNFEGA